MSIASMETQTYKPFRWFILATLVAVVTVQAIALISPATLIGEIMATNPDLSAGQVTWMTMGTWNLFVALAAITGGPLLDRLGFTKMYLFGMAMIGIGWLLMPVIGETFMGMTAARTIQALGGGPIMGAGVYISATCFPKHERSLVNGALGFSMGLGLALGLAITPRVLGLTGNWATALQALSPLTLIGLAMTVIVILGPKVAPEQPDDEPAEDISSTTNRAIFRKAISMPITWVAIGCVVLASWFNQAYNDMTPGYLALDAPIGLGFGPEGAGNIASIAQIGNMIGCIAVGFIVERIFRGRARPALVIAFAGIAVGAATLLLPAINQNGLSLGTFMLITVFFLGWINATALGWIAKNYPAKITGKLGGLAQGIGIFGGLAGVAFGSAALHATGFYTVSTMIMVAVGAVGIGLATFMTTNKQLDFGQHEA